MTIFYFILLGLLQGLTEFLPVSSSGHILILSKLFGIGEPLFVGIVLHVATLLSIIVVMRKEILYLIKHPLSKEMRQLCLSTILTLIMIFLLYDIAKQSYFEAFVPFAFMLTAVILILTELLSKKERNLTGFSYKNSIIMGIAQGLAIFPGLSRSGTTICAGMICGGERKQVSKFSFLMSIPIIIGSMIMEIIDLSQTKVIFNDYLGLVLGFVVAFIVGIFALKIMIKATSKIKLKYFAYYLIVLSIITLFI